jgi:hypothetical protein
MLRISSILRRNSAHLIREKGVWRKTIVSIALNMQKES